MENIANLLREYVGKPMVGKVEKVGNDWYGVVFPGGKSSVRIPKSYCVGEFVSGDLIKCVITRADKGRYNLRVEKVPETTGSVTEERLKRLEDTLGNVDGW